MITAGVVFPMGSVTLLAVVIFCVGGGSPRQRRQAQGGLAQVIEVLWCFSSDSASSPSSPSIRVAQAEFSHQSLLLVFSISFCAAGAHSDYLINRLVDYLLIAQRNMSNSCGCPIYHPYLPLWVLRNLRPCPIDRILRFPHYTLRSQLVWLVYDNQN